MQTSLDEGMIEGGVLLAAGHKGKAGQIREHRSGSIQPVEPQQRPLRWELIRAEIACDRSQSLVQFLPIASVASVSETAEPVITTGIAEIRAKAATAQP